MMNYRFINQSKNNYTDLELRFLRRLSLVTPSVALLRPLPILSLLFPLPSFSLRYVWNPRVSDWFRISRSGAPGMKSFWRRLTPVFRRGCRKQGRVKSRLFGWIILIGALLSVLVFIQLRRRVGGGSDSPDSDLFAVLGWWGVVVVGFLSIALVSRRGRRLLLSSRWSLDFISKARVGVLFYGGVICLNPGGAWGGFGFVAGVRRMVLRRRLINPLSILCLPLPSAFAGGEAFPVTAQSRIMVSSLECFIGLWTPSISVGPRFSGKVKNLL